MRVSVTLVKVMFACNDEHGNQTNRVDQVHVGFETAELAGPELVFRRLASGVLRVGRRLFRIHGYKEWVGNWCWDQALLSAGEATRLLMYLRERGWDIEAGESRLFNEWKNGHELTMLRQLATRGKRL